MGVNKKGRARKARSAAATSLTCNDAAALEHYDLCAGCGMGESVKKGGDGALMPCKSCPRVFHSRCAAELEKRLLPNHNKCDGSDKEGNDPGPRKQKWACAHCVQGTNCGKRYLTDASRFPLTIARAKADRGLSLGTFLQQLELICEPSKFQSVVQKVVELRKNEEKAASGVMQPIVGSPGNGMLGMAVLFRTIVSSVGHDLIRRALKLAQTDNAPAIGFGTMGGRNDETQKCRECGQWRVLRTACLYCGTSCAINNGLTDFKPSINSREMSKLRLRLRNVITKAPVIGYKVARDVIRSYEGIEVLATMKWDAMSRGIHYFGECARESGAFEAYGGDIMFLMYKLTHILSGHRWLRKKATNQVTRLVKYWMGKNIHVPISCELDRLLNIIEALHVVKRMGFDGAKASRSAPSSPRSSARNCPADNASESGRKRKRGSLDDFVSQCTSMTLGKRGASKRASALISRMTEDAPTARTASKRSKPMEFLNEEKIAVAAAVDFDFSTVLQEVASALLRHDISDLVGFEPSQGQLPMTPAEHCSHCGHINPKKRHSRCVACGHALKAKVDYGCLTDAFVWSYVFKSLDLPVKCIGVEGSGSSIFSDILRLLPQARSYQTIDELGHDFYKLQCYFLTHFIYIMSDWGRCKVPLELFWEEYKFILSNMEHVIALDDAEIVGEFVHCLRILCPRSSYSAKNDPRNSPHHIRIVEEGVAYLLIHEKRRGCKGLWVSGTKEIYSRYHAAYTGVAGLADSEYASAAKHDWKRIPDFFTLDDLSSDDEGGAGGKE